MDFAIPADHRVKLKWDKYSYLVRELEKKLGYMKVTVMPVVIGAVGTVTKEIVTELEDLDNKGQVEIIQNSALLWRDLATTGNMLSLRLQWKTIG